MPAQMLEEWRIKARERIDKAKARIEEWRTPSGASRTRSALSPQGLIKEVREKGLVETYHARREARRGGGSRTTRPAKEYRKEVAMEGSGAQLKVQKPRISIEA